MDLQIEIGLVQTFKSSELKNISGMLYYNLKWVETDKGVK